jgi:hypothetical protein
MNFFARSASLASSAAVVCALLLASCSMMPSSNPNEHRLTLTGAEEVPPVPTSATATGTITINPDGTLSGSITTHDMTSTVSHIHMGPPGTVSPVIVPLVKSGETYSVPPGAKLTDAQMAAYRAGNLYVNVHSAKYPVGEIRAQIRP